MSTLTKPRLPPLRCRDLATAALLALPVSLQGSLPAATRAQEPAAAADLAELLAPIRAEHGVPALAALVLEHSTVTAIGAVGTRRNKHDEPVGQDDRWHLGSCTKAMTATLLAIFVERGALRWDTTLEQALPELAESMHADYRGVTVRQLVDHRAGLPANPLSLLELAARKQDDTPLREQRREIVAEVLAREPRARPGSDYHYANTGFVIAGAIVERIADAAWEDVVRRELFAPLGMTSAGFGAPGADGTPAPWGHLRFGPARVPADPATPAADNPRFYGPAGTVHASLRDWAKFIAVHVHADREPTLLERSAIDAMHEPVPGADYSCGFAVATRAWAKGKVLAHSGTNTIWYATVWISLADDIAFLAACNEGGDAGARACDQAVSAAIRRWQAAREAGARGASGASGSSGK